MNSKRISASLFPIVAFALAALGAARADDLLDSVLSEKPSAVPAADGSTIDAALSAPAAQTPATAVNGPAAKDASQNTATALATHQNAVGDNATLALSGLMVSDFDLKSGSAVGETTKKNSTFLIRGGAGLVDDDNSDPDSSLALNFDLEIRFQLWNSPFDLSFRGFALHQREKGEDSYQDTYYTYWYSWYSGMHSYRHTRTIYYDWEWSETRAGAEAMLLFVPWRGTIFEPFAGAGIRGEHVAWEYDGRDVIEDDDSDSCFSYRIGLKINVGRAFLKGEYIAGGDIGDYDGTRELIGSLGLHFRSGLLLQLNIDSFEFDSYAKGIAFGGGLGFGF